MADKPTPQSPLKRHSQPAPQPGLSVEEVPGMTQVQVILRKHKGPGPLEGLAKDGVSICTTGPGEFWAFSEQHDTHGTEKRLGKVLGESASLFDQSHGRLVLRIEGPGALEVLARGTPLDLAKMPAASATHTVIEHIPVLIARHRTTGRYDISVPRSYAVSFIAWLAEAI